MSKDIYWINGPIPGRMAVMARPRAGEWLEDSIAGWKKNGIHLVVSLLEPAEADKLGLMREAEICQKFSLTFLSHPFPDRGVPPSPDETAALVQALRSHLLSRKNIAIHCHSAMGRSAVIAACVLRSFGVEAKKAFELVASARGFMVPDTNQQREWVAAFGAEAAPAPVPAPVK